MGIATRLQEYFAPDPNKVRARDVVRELPEGFASEVGRPILRAAAPVFTSTLRLGNRIQAAIDPTKTYKDLRTPDITPEGDFQKKLFGTDETLALRRTAKEAGLKEDSPFAPALGFALGAADLVPGGKQTKQIIGLTDDAVTTILRSRNVDKIKDILLRSGKVASEDAEPLARALKHVDTLPDFKKVTKNLLERGFIKSVKTVVPGATKVAGQYVPRNTDDLAIKARNLILDNQELAERVVREKADDQAVAVASELVKKYSDDALAAAKAGDVAKEQMLYDRLADIVNPFAEKLTELGRAVQAASILGRSTPEGQLRFAARTIQSFNEKNPTKKIPELSAEDIKFVTEKMRQVEALPDGMDKARLFKEVQDFIQNKIPTPLIKKIVTVWKAGLLTGLKTTGLNIFSTTAHGVLETIKDIPAAGIDSVASLFTGKRTKTFTLRGTGSGVAEGFRKGKMYWKTGFDERNVGEKLDYNKVNFGTGKVAKLFQTYTDTVFRTIGAQDQVFYYGATARSLHDQALAVAKNVGLRGDGMRRYAEELVSNPTEEMIAQSVVDATTAVFQNKTALSEAGEKLRSIGKGAGEFVIPFNRTPAAVAMQILNYSPVGIVRAVVENIGKGKFDQRKFSEMMSRGTIGTVPMYIGFKLFENDMVQLEYPETARERALYEAEGRKDNSILINGKWRDPIVLGPAGNLILMGAYYARGYQEVGSPSGGMYQGLKTAALGTLSAFKEQTFLSGINNFMNAFDNPQRNLEGYASSLAGSLVPTLVSDIARATDTKERRVEGDLLTKPGEAIKNRLPGLRQTLEPKVDALGNAIEIKGNPLELMIDPTRPFPDESTPLTRELRRLTEEGLKVAPTKLGKSKEGYPVLTPEQNTELWETTGSMVREKLERLMVRKEYTMATDDARAKAIERIVDQVKIDGRAAMVIEEIDGLTGDAMRKRLSELKAGGLLNEDVLRRVKELR